MFDINEAFIQALQKQELEEAIDYKNDRYNATTAEDTADEREFYGKHMTKRDKVRSLDQAKRNLDRIGKDPRVTTGQAVDQISFEDTLYTDIANYKDNKNWAKKSAEKGDTLWANEHNKQANKFANKIRAKHNKKQENASITVTHDVNSEDEALDLVNDTSYFNVGDEVEVKDWNGRTYTVKKTKDIKYKNGKRIEEAVETNINVNDPEISKDRMEELMPKMLEFIKENDYENHYFEDLAQNGMYSRMRIFGGLSDKFYDYVQAYEQVISAMAHKNKTDYVTDLLKYDRDILNLSNEECPLVTTNLTVRKEIANRLGVKDDAPESVVTESKKEEFLDANINVDTGDISSNLDLGGLGSLAGLMASEETKESEEKLEEDTGKKSLTYQYEENGNYFYKDDNGTVYADMSFQPDKIDLWVCSAEYNEPIKQVNANEFELNGNPKTDKNFERNEKYKGSYMLLSRLESDCKYYLGNGNRNEKVLWAGSVDKQIAKMKELWNNFPDDMKPEWLSMEDIENYEREMKTEMKTEAEETKGATITQELHTDLLPILNMYQYDIADGVEISREELDEVMQDKAMPIIEETIKNILPTAEVKAGKFYNPPYYRFGSGNNDQLDFTVTVPEADYKKLEADTLAKEDFEEFLKKTYKSYDGFISTMPDSIKEFEEAEDWEQFVAILSYYITPYEHQEEFTADVLDYIWGNFPTEEDEDEYDDETNWAAEEEAEADERFENRYMNGGNGFTADKKDESKKMKKEASQDLYNKIKEEPRTEKFEKGSKLKDEIIEAWKNNDLKTAYTKWEELYTLFSTEENFTEEQNLRNMIELTMITDQIEDKCVYDVTDYGKDQEYRKMGYRK